LRTRVSWPVAAPGTAADRDAPPRGQWRPPDSAVGAHRSLVDGGRGTPIGSAAVAHHDRFIKVGASWSDFWLTLFL